MFLEPGKYSSFGVWLGVQGGPKRVLDGFSLDVGYIDDPGSVHVVVRDADGDQIDELIADTTGIVSLTSMAPGAASFVVETVAGESAGFAIDNLSFDPPVPSLAALGDSYSSGEGNPPFDASSGACHRSPQAWPRLLDTRNHAESFHTAATAQMFTSYQGPHNATLTVHTTRAGAAASIRRRYASY